MSRLGYLIQKEFIQLFRSRAMIAISFGMPIIQLVVIGFAISGDIERIPTAVADLDRSTMSRALVEKLTHSRFFDVRQFPNDVRAVEPILERGDAIIALTIPEHFERDLVRGETPAISLTADAQNTNVALTGAGYVTRIFRLWVEQTVAKSRAASVQIHTVSLETLIWYNPELKSSYFMVPAIIVILVTVISLLLTALAIVRERGDKNTLEQLLVTPISRLELILGKTIPFGIVGMIELTLALIVAKIVYDIPIAGSLPAFYLMSAVFMMSTIGMGILVSTITTSQQQALFAAWFVMIFCLMMSGFFLPLDNMPRIMYWLTYLNPLRYYVTIVRELFLKGSGIHDLWTQVAALAAIATAVLTLAVARFHKRLG
jgi:ABC-2 type transport system permease protein